MGGTNSKISCLLPRMKKPFQKGFPPRGANTFLQVFAGIEERDKMKMAELFPP